MAALRDAERALPVELFETRPGRAVAVHSRVAGTSRPLVFFVHGSMATLLQWSAQIDAVEAAGYDAVAFDWIGCGRSPKPEGWEHYTPDALYADLAAIFDAHARGRRAALVAHSYGCDLALRLAVARADAISRIVLMSPAEAMPRMPLTIFRLPQRVLEWIQPSLSASFEAAAIADAEATPAAAKLCAAINGANAMHVCKAYYRQVELHADPRAVRATTLVLAGTEDAVIPPAASERVAASLPSAHFALVPRTSHQLMMEAPDAVSGLVLEFLTRGTASGTDAQVPPTDFNHLLEPEC